MSRAKNNLLVFGQLIALVGLLSGCITINIYFPAAAAEKAADKVIDEIWQTLPDGSQPAMPVNNPSAPSSNGDTAAPATPAGGNP